MTLEEAPAAASTISRLAVVISIWVKLVGAVQSLPPGI